MGNIKGVIFDMDGTLLDSMNVWSDIDQEFWRRRNRPIPPGYLEAVTPMGFRLAAEYTIREYGLSETVPAIMAEWQAMAVEQYSSSIRTKPYAKELLEDLQKKGVLCAVATASHRELYEPALRNNGIDRYFHSVTAVSEVGKEKGSPDIYLAAAEKMELSPAECMVVEDIYAGVRAAKEGGFYTVGIYESAAEYERDKIMETADLYIMDFSQLIGHAAFE